eukprot:4880965-Amphidinium_carterae.1
MPAGHSSIVKCITPRHKHTNPTGHYLLDLPKRTASNLEGSFGPSGNHIQLCVAAQGCLTQLPKASAMAKTWPAAESSVPSELRTHLPESQLHYEGRCSKFNHVSH